MTTSVINAFKMSYSGGTLVFVFNRQTMKGEESWLNIGRKRVATLGIGVKTAPIGQPQITTPRIPSRPLESLITSASLKKKRANALSKNTPPKCGEKRRECFPPNGCCLQECFASFRGGIEYQSIVSGARTCRHGTCILFHAFPKHAAGISGWYYSIKLFFVKTRFLGDPPMLDRGRACFGVR